MTSTVMQWLALHRAHEGGLTKLGGDYFTQGWPVAGHLAAVLDELVSAGLLAFGQPGPSGQLPVCVTHCGQARYLELGGHSGRARPRAGSDGR